MELWLCSHSYFYTLQGGAHFIGVFPSKAKIKLGDSVFSICFLSLHRLHNSFFRWLGLSLWVGSPGNGGKLAHPSGSQGGNAHLFVSASYRSTGKTVRKPLKKTHFFSLSLKSLLPESPQSRNKSLSMLSSQLGFMCVCVGVVGGVSVCWLTDFGYKCLEHVLLRNGEVPLSLQEICAYPKECLVIFFFWCMKESGIQVVTPNRSKLCGTRGLGSSLCCTYLQASYWIKMQASKHWVGGVTPSSHTPWYFLGSMLHFN